MNINEITVPFGKHRGTPLSEMDPGYLRWMVRKAGDSDAWDGLVSFVNSNRESIESAINGSQRAALAKVSADYTLNESQKASSAFLSEWLQGVEPAAKLEGGAGYGKSFTVMDVVRNAIEQGYRVHACATSYVATQVLSKQLAALAVEAKTIASTFRLNKVTVDSKSEYVWSPDSDEMVVEHLGRKRLLIVDEYSMVGDDIGRRLLAGAEHHGGKLLAVGDLKQLPPVGQYRDSVLAGITLSTTLTEPMRYSADSDLYTLEQMARNTPEEVARHDWTGSAGIHLHPSVEALLETYVADSKAAPKEDARVLFFRRADVVSANATIRAGLYGAERAEQFPVIEDERLMVMATVDIQPVGTTSKEDRLRFYSGTSYMVERVQAAEIDDVPCYVVKLDNGVMVPIMFMVTEYTADHSKLGGPEYTAKLRALADHAELTGSWVAYHEFKNLFLPVGYNYAMTVHRCQGQTVDRVYFAPAKLSAGYMTSSLLYVASTRAKRAVHMVINTEGE